MTVYRSAVMSKHRFDPDSTWRIDGWGGGCYGSLEQCLEIWFEVPSRINNLTTRKHVRNRCLEVGYVSINGWTVCYVTDDNESTLDMEAGQ